MVETSISMKYELKIFCDFNKIDSMSESLITDLSEVDRIALSNTKLKGIKDIHKLKISKKL